VRGLDHQKFNLLPLEAADEKTELHLGFNNNPANRK